MGEEQKAWLVIANAKAGTSDADAIEAVMTVLRGGPGADLVETEDSDDLKAALGAVPDGGTVVALGGDGSLHAVVTVLDMIDRLADVVVALVPLGTGNDFARTIGMDRDDPAAAARQLLRAEACPLDVVRNHDGRVVVNAVHVGIGAEAAVEARPLKRALGPVGYAMGAIVSGIKHRGFLGSVTVDGVALEKRKRIIQVAVGNGRYIGGGAPLLPEADPADGLLDVAVSWSNPRLHRVAYAWRLRKGRHPQRDDVDYLKGTHVILVGEPQRGNLDGEICPPARWHEWRVEPAAMTMLLPRPQDFAEPANT